VPSVSEAEQSAQPGLHKTVGSNRTRQAPCSESGQLNSQSTSKHTTVIDLTMGDEIVVMPYSTPCLPNQIVSSRLLVATLPDRVVTQLEDWYTHKGRLDLPPFAVGPQIAKRINQWDSGQPVCWSYRGLEELSVMPYPLEGFEYDRKRFIIVAQGPTKGPFIIKWLEKKKRYLPPVSYHIWEGWDRAEPSEYKGFERKPSVLKCVRLQNIQHGLTQTMVGGPLQTSGFPPASARVFDNNSQTQQSTQPVRSERVSWSKSNSQPQMICALPNLAPAAEKFSAIIAYETAQEAIFPTSPIRSPSGNASQQGLPLEQIQNVDISSSPIVSSTISQTIKSALPIVPHPSISHGLAAEVSHTLTSTPQCGTPKNIVSPPNWKMPSMMPPSPALTETQSVAKELTPTFNPVEQQTIQHMDRPTVPYTSPPLAADRERPGRQECQVKFCHRVLTRLMHPRLSHLNQPFLEPVDPVGLNLPTYFQVIKQPMDLSSIRGKLKAGDYEDAEEFRKDINIMFKNCSTFNRESDPVYNCGHLLNQIFINLWILWKPREQDNCHTQEVNTHSRCNDSWLSMPREARPTIEPFTPPTISAPSPTQEYVAEESRALSPLRGLVEGAQTSDTDIHTEGTPRQDNLPDITTLQPCQDSLISSDEQQLPSSSGQTNSNPCGQCPNDLNVHQFTDHGSHTRHASPVLSEASWETMRSTRETSYFSEMLMEAEREFFLSEPKDDQGVIRSDDSARDGSSPVCKRKWESTKGKTDEAAESVSVKRPLTMYPSQTPFQAHSQATLEETCSDSELLSEDLFVTTLRDQLVPWKEVHERYNEAFGKNLSEDALRMREARQTDKSSIKRTGASDDIQPDSGLSLTWLTSSCPAPPPAIQRIRGSSLRPLTEALELEDPQSLGLSGILTEHDSSPLQCSYGNGCKKAFTRKTDLNRHVKTVRRTKPH
jgi:hypothetical protein